MKILYVTTVTSTINAFLVPHIEQLVQEGHQVDVASAENQPLNPQLDQLGCQFYPIDFTRSALSLQHTRSYRQIRQLIKKRGYDVVHTHTPIASFIVRAASRDLAVKVVYTAHGFHFHQAASVRTGCCITQWNVWPHGGRTSSLRSMTKITVIHNGCRSGDTSVLRTGSGFAQGLISWRRILTAKPGVNATDITNVTQFSCTPQN